MLFSDFQDKSVVNVVDGSELGYVTDVSFDPITGKIFRITVSDSCGGILGFFKNNEEYTIFWEQIIKIGEDVIIVNFPLEYKIPNQEDQ